jgi:hypothetical protein
MLLCAFSARNVAVTNRVGLPMTQSSIKGKLISRQTLGCTKALEHQARERNQRLLFRVPQLLVNLGRMKGHDGRKDHPVGLSFGA